MCVYVCMHVYVREPRERSEIHKKEESVGRVRILSIDGCVQGKGHILQREAEKPRWRHLQEAVTRKRCTDSFDLSSCGGSVLSVSAEGGAWGGKETRQLRGICREEGQDC